MLVADITVEESVVEAVALEVEDVTGTIPLLEADELAVTLVVSCEV